MYDAGGALQHDTFPLTSIQQAYWIGRQGGLDLGGVSTHTYLEIDVPDLDVERVRSAWHILIERHPMLRAIVLPSGEQRILDSPPAFHLPVLDLRGLSIEETQRRLEQQRQQLSHEVLAADRWPLFTVRASLLDRGVGRLHLSFDALIVDGRSRAVLLRECAALYRDRGAKLAPLSGTYREFAELAQTARNTDRYRQAREYWLRRLPDLPGAPALPLRGERNPAAPPRFERVQAWLEQGAFDELGRRAAGHGVRTTTILLAAFASVLARWSSTRALTLNLTLFDRAGREARFEGVVGDFTTLMLLAVDSAAGGTFAQRVLRLQERLDEGLAHSDFNAVEVLREMRRRRGGAPAAAMPVVFTSMIGSDRVRGNVLEHAADLGILAYAIGQTPQIWLDSFACLIRGRLLLFWDHVAELFPPGLIRDMFAAYIETLQRLASDTSAWHEPWRATASRMLPASARLGTAPAHPLPGTDGGLHLPFFGQCRARPQATAVIDGERRLSYADTARHALAVMLALHEHGIAAGSRVAVVMEKGWEQIVAVLGVLAAGAAFVPIDPGLPRRRLAELLNDCAAACVLIQSRLREHCDDAGAGAVLAVDDIAPRDQTTIEPAKPDPDGLAYVIYTSGSTGRPKGVMISHRAALNTVLDVNERFGVGADDRVLGLSALSFDLSIYDIFGTLAAGATLVLPNAIRVRDPAHWLEQMHRHHVTVWNSVPALLSLLVEHARASAAGSMPDLRLALLSGDWIPLMLPDAARRVAPNAQLISLGGATEGAIWSICFPIQEIDPTWRSIPYGCPLHNQSVVVLDSDLEPCPTWVAGELYIGGAGVALGYMSDPERTAAQFVVHPVTGERLYRTGDEGRWLPDGNIELLGRLDHQIKVQGFRVEPGEIEAALAFHAGVSDMLVLAQGERHEDKRLVAYVVPAQWPAPESLASALRAHLQARLPAYMVPTDYVMLQAFPLTANGKVDRSALPPPHSSPAASASNDSVPAYLSDLVAGVLGRAAAADQNLLALGATSMDMIRVINAVEEKTGSRPALDAFYQEPTLSGLARLIGTEQAVAAAPATSAERSVIRDPAERERFKRARRSLRRFPASAPGVVLPESTADDRVPAPYARRSRRHYRLAPVPLSALARLLHGLRETTDRGAPQRRYASAGGTYAIQVYLYVKPGRVADLAAGAYYYDPAGYRLVALRAGAHLDRQAFPRHTARPAFDEAAFGIFLVMDPGAILPLYGERSERYALLEAGAMGQLIEDAGPPLGVGLCAIGGADSGAVASLFELEPDHHLLYAFVGGRIDPATENTDIDPAARETQRVRDLSDEERRQLIATLRQTP